MGGPCLIDSNNSSNGVVGLRRLIRGRYYILAPPPTDNFHVVPSKFEFEGARFYSCEQAFQAAKFTKGSESRRLLEDMHMHPGEDDEEFGNRCWVLGQDKAYRRENWDFIKIKVMLSVNRAKYAQHGASRQRLLSTGHAPLLGNPFTTSWTDHKGETHSWATWNGLIQSLIREELKRPEDQNRVLIESFLRQIGAYSYSDPNELRSPLLKELDELRNSFGLIFPFHCSACTFFEKSFPSQCSVCDTPNKGYTLAKQRQKAEQAVLEERTPVLLITDIGADIDDTLAILTLIGSDHLFLAGVVTTVNNGVKRAALVHQWLQVMGVRDTSVPVLPFCDFNTAGCSFPEGFNSAFSSPISRRPDDTPRGILEIISKFGSRLVILAIAPVSPLAAALRMDDDLGLLQCVRRVYMEGNAGIHTSPSTSTSFVSPCSKAYNFRCDMAAAEEVFKELQRYKVHISLLGKYAAYQIKLTKGDLDSLKVPSVPSLTIIARDQMQEFKRQNPELFFQLFSIPEQFRTNHNNTLFEWFDHLPDDVISTPYDALVVLMADEDAIEAASVQTHSAVTSSSLSPSSSHVWFKRSIIADGCEAVGNNEPPADHGVQDSVAVRAAIVERIKRAVNSSRKI